MTAIELLEKIFRGRQGGASQGGASAGRDILSDILGGGGAAEEAPRQAPAPRASQPAPRQESSGSVVDMWRREPQGQPAPAPARPTAPAATQDRWKSGESILRRPQPPAPAETQEDEAVHLIRAMINAARADGEMDQEEEQKILGHLGDPSPEVLAFIRGEFEKPLDLREFAWSIPLGLETKIYSLTLAVMNPDTRAESHYLAELAHGLRLQPAVCQQIQQRLGLPGRR